MTWKQKKNTKLSVEKAPQAPSDLDHGICLEKLCGLKKKFTSIGHTNIELLPSECYNILNAPQWHKPRKNEKKYTVSLWFAINIKLFIFNPPLWEEA